MQKIMVNLAAVEGEKGVRVRELVDLSCLKNLSQVSWGSLQLGVWGALQSLQRGPGEETWENFVKQYLIDATNSHFQSIERNNWKWCYGTIFTDLSIL